MYRSVRLYIFCFDMFCFDQSCFNHSICFVYVYSVSSSLLFPSFLLCIDLINLCRSVLLCFTYVYFVSYCSGWFRFLLGSVRFCFVLNQSCFNLFWSVSFDTFFFSSVTFRSVSFMCILFSFVIFLISGPFYHFSVLTIYKGIV